MRDSLSGLESTGRREGGIHLSVQALPRGACAAPTRDETKRGDQGSEEELTYHNSLLVLQQDDNEIASVPIQSIIERREEEKGTDSVDELVSSGVRGHLACPTPDNARDAKQ